MTLFTEQNLLDDGGWLSYAQDGYHTPHANRKFIANFTKHKGGRASFKKFIMKHFTVEEYLALYAEGKAPLVIAESKGYMTPQIKKILKQAGYPTTPAGRNCYLADSRRLRLVA